ncbi:winged helix-turn-helix transcriptional regulator [Streptomyces albus subsp. chlorinus]|uniref:MarR family winged helix-turn-helix transcriptional regulator n=1 Tax=Streptomyces albus TaxID=1888 RepID=UPI0015702F93|nr:MarR family winged helix-turn-helix transcriptional regulator [Streptomyces albus]NSC22579.1 winged helix-turn-helix transcriptional regulator [Streptomyces albus subsp. chlorinus]
MAERSQYEELARQISAIGAVKREMARGLPPECPPASAAVLMLLSKHGEMRTSRLAELMAIDMSVTSRHVAHVADRGWIERHPDPQDGRSRLLRISESGERFLTELSAHTTESLAAHLHDWSDEDVAQLNTLLSRLRTSFGDCRSRGGQPHETTTTATH